MRKQRPQVAKTTSTLGKERREFCTNSIEFERTKSTVKSADEIYRGRKIKMATGNQYFGILENIARFIREVGFERATCWNLAE